VVESPAEEERRSRSCDHSERAEQVDIADGRIERIEIRERRWYELFYELRFPFTYFSIPLAVLLCGGLTATFVIFLFGFPDLEWHDEPLSDWFLMMLVMAGLWVGLEMAVGLVLYGIGRRFFQHKAYYYASGLRFASVLVAWGILGLIMQPILLNSLDNEFKDGLQNFFVAVLVVGLLYALRVSAEKTAILHVSAKTYQRMMEAMLQQKVLKRVRRVWVQDGKEQIRWSTRHGVQRLAKLRDSFSSVGHSADAGTGSGEAGGAEEDVADNGDEQPEGTFLKHATSKLFLRGPSPLLETRTPEEVLPDSTRLFLQEMQRAEEQVMAEKVTAMMMRVLDTEGKGYVVQEDFSVLFGDVYTQQQAFLAFNKQFLKRLREADLRKAVAASLSSAEMIRRGMNDREDVASILRYCCGVLFWSLMIVVVLIIFGVDPLTAILPYLSVLLVFSFAFGSTIRNVLESAILVLVIAPYEVGDRVLIAGDPDPMIVDRINLFHTIVHKRDGRYIEVPNSKVSRNSIYNCHRSLPVSFGTSIEISSNTPQATISSLVDRILEASSQTDLFAPGTTANVKEINHISSLVITFWVATRNEPWSDVKKVQAARTVFNNLILHTARDLNVSYSFPIQPVDLLKKTQ